MADIGEFASNAGLVVVARCQDALEAALLQGLLAAEGVPALIADAATAQAYPLAALAFGGIRILVPAGRAHAARQVLAALAAGDYAIDETTPTEPAP